MLCGARTKRGTTCKLQKARCPYHHTQRGGGPELKLGISALDTLCENNRSPRLDLRELIINDDGTVSYLANTYSTTRKVLGEGGFGTVIEVRLVGTKMRFVMKRMLRPKPGRRLQQASLAVSGMKQRYEASCKKMIADYRMIDDYTVIMNAAVSDLSKLKGTLSVPEVSAIIEQMRVALLCLQQQGLYYMDIKPENLLLMCHSDGSEVVLGDQGSMLPHKKKNAYVTHYAPPSYFRTYLPVEYVQENYDSLYMYQLAVLAAVLLTPKKDYKVSDSERSMFKKDLINYGPSKHVLSNVPRENVPKHIQKYAKYLDSMSFENHENEEFVKNIIDAIVTEGTATSLTVGF